MTVQACGDAHLANFGLFASPERNLVFDVNDFDETSPGPWEWDVKRLAASVEIAARHIDCSSAQRRRVVRATVESYRRAMRGFAGLDTLSVWYARSDADTLSSLTDVRLRASQRKLLDRTTTSARSKDNLGALGRFATLDDGGGARLTAEPPLIVPLRDLLDSPADRAARDQQLRGLLSDYRATLEPERRVLLDQYRLVDMARKVVGVGSVGTRAWMLLLVGGHGADPPDPLFLQAKEAGPSVLEEFVGPSGFENAGQRVVVGQRLMQTVSDIFLGWVRVDGLDGRSRDYYVRQLRDWKASADIEKMVPSGLRAYGEICGWTLARAHARTGDRFALAAYLGRGDAFDVAVQAFASAYADQTERDHRQLLAAIASGRIRAET
jgi:uncharacterized protein (DUF2252 family)